MANTPPKIPSGFSSFTHDKRVEGGVKFFKSSMARSDIWMALGIVFMLVILILPMPSWLLDVCLALSITMSVLVMMTSIFIEKPTQFTSFPLVLLITTMYRLSLNLASTRLILGDGHLGKGAAGNVIEAFGSFVMGGNFVIGVIVFAILVIVNFMVITKGSGRIAEVAARFTLDAMAGKQMAIDADLSSGIIDEKEAIKRREELSQENSFYGAMDGASKFVRGDAIAGLMITAINVIAGMIIGMAQNNLSFSEASETYIRLTVGDGLVSQIPALVISMAAGIMVSKAGMTKATDQVVLGQLTHYPKAMGMSAALGTVMAFLPGMPAIPFLFFASICGGTAYVLDKQKKIAKQELEAKEKEDKTIKPPPVSEEPIANALKIDLIRLELGYGLITLINDTGNRRLTDQIKALRRALAIENGFVMPSVRIQDNMQLPANMYIVYVKEVESGRGEVRPHQLLVMDPRGDEITLPGEKTKEPTFGLPATWIDPINREEAMFRGYTVVDAPTVITTHITEIVKSYMSELLSYTETQKLLDDLKEQQKLVKELLDGKITIGGVQRVLQNLLQERVSIRDLPTILEGISEALAVTRSTMMITEHVRYRLARHICSANADIDGVIKLVVMSPEWEQIFAESLVGQGDEKQLAIPPIKVQQFVNKVRQVFEDLAAKGESPVLMTTPTIRPYVRSIVDRFRPLTVVLSQNEIHPRFKIRTMGQI